MAEFLLIEPCNFVDYPTGGQLTMARQLMKVFGNRLALVGFTTEKSLLGQWTKRVIDGIEYDYFSLYHRSKTSQKPIFPGRVKSLLKVRQYHKDILKLGINKAFIQSQEVMIAVKNWDMFDICYRFPGTENPLAISRYGWARSFAKLFDQFFFPSVERADTILVTADDDAINEMIARSKGCVTHQRVSKFPTRVDTSVFCPKDRHDLRVSLDLPLMTPLFVTTGRIHWAKGWQLLLGSFAKFRSKERAGMLVFVGDGEDRPLLEAMITKLGLEEKVRVVGRQPPEIVAQYIQASDVFVMGSQKEGWSTSMVEALACGKPIVSTFVSSSTELISQGVNGSVVYRRDENEYAEAMASTLKLDINKVERFSLVETEKYALSNLRQDLETVWKAISN